MTTKEKIERYWVESECSEIEDQWGRLYRRISLDSFQSWLKENKLRMVSSNALTRAGYDVWLGQEDGSLKSWVNI